MRLIVMLLNTEPGGHLQWSEPDLATTNTRKSDPSNPTSALDEVLRLATSKGPKMQPNWVKDLPALFEEAGLEDVKEDVVKASERDSFGMYECNMLAFEMMLGKGDEVTKLTGEAARQARRGVMLEVDRVCIVGKKRLTTEE